MNGCLDMYVASSTSFLKSSIVAIPNCAPRNVSNQDLWVLRKDRIYPSHSIDPSRDTNSTNTALPAPYTARPAKRQSPSTDPHSTK
jgi:hypothetical protein